MKKIITTNRYEKQLKKLNKDPNFTKEIKDKLNQCISNLVKGEKLDPQYKDHALVKSSPVYKREGGIISRDFHLRPNLCVVYKLSPDALNLLAIGSHQDLGLTENINH